MARFALPFTTFRGLRGRLFMALALIIAGLVVADFFNLFGYYEDLLETAQTDTSNLSRSLAEQTDATFETADALLLGLRERVETDGLAAPAQARLKRLMDTRLQLLPYLHQLAIVDASGRVIVSSGRIAAGTVLPPSEMVLHRTDPARTPHLGVLQRDAGGAAWIIPITRRIDRADGSFGGMVLASISNETFRERFREYRNGKLGICLLAREDGRAIARWPADPRGEGFDMSHGELFSRIIQPGDRSRFTYVGAVDHTRRLGSYNRLHFGPALVVVSRSRSEVLAPWRRVFATHALGVALLASFTGLLGQGLARNIAEVERAQKVLRVTNARLAASEIASMRANAALELAQQIAQVGHWTVNLAGSPEVTWSEEVYRIHGLDSRRHQPTLENGLAVYHEADRPLVTAVVNAAISAGTPIEFTARLVRPDGSIRHVLSRGVAETDATGAIVGIFGVFLDITKQQRNEEALRSANSEAEAANEALESANRALEAMAMQDALTGLANRRQFDRSLDQEFRRAVRAEVSLALILIDVDHFKQFNDLYGHVAGDACLRMIAGVIPTLLNRPGDTACRYGGEELAVLLPGNSEAGAIAIAGRIADAVRALGIPHAGSAHGVVTISAGVEAFAPVHDQDVPSEMVVRADRALYAAKRTGRDRVLSHRAICETTDMRVLGENARLPG